MAGDHGVLDQGIARRDELHARRADVNPGAGGELEVLGDAPSKASPRSGFPGSANFSASPMR